MKPITSITIVETTVGDLSHYRLGVADIWVRELPDEQGKIEPRLSASLSVFDENTKEETDHEVFVGSIIHLDDGNYQVTDMDEGSSTPGSLTLQKIS